MVALVSMFTSVSIFFFKSGCIPFEYARFSLVENVGNGIFFAGVFFLYVDITVFFSCGLKLSDIMHKNREESYCLSVI